MLLVMTMMTIRELEKCNEFDKESERRLLPTSRFLDMNGLDLIIISFLE